MSDTDEGPAGRWYELFTRDIYQALVSQGVVRNIEVKHNVTLTGRSGATHQIDVYWEFEIAGTRYRTCIECKNFTSPVKKFHVASFATILADIGNATGIFVTSEGFQSGAEKLAADQRIRLIVLNPLVRTVNLECDLIAPDYQKIDIKIDVDACKPILQAAGRQSLTLSKMGSGDDFVLLDAQGSRRCTLNEFVRTHPGTEGHHSLSLAGYFLASEIGPLPLLSIDFDIVLHTISSTFAAEAEHMAKAVIEDVLAHTRMYVNEDGTLQSSEPQADDAG